MKIEIPIPKTFLMIDAMYYHSARRSFNQANKMTTAIQRHKNKINALQEKWDRITKKYAKDSEKCYKYQEKIIRQFEDTDYSLGTAYAPFLQALAITHIMCAAALESHINAQSKELLQGKSFEHFERITIEGKWLFLPRILGAKGFDPGAQPYQGFSKLISIRNELIHYKGQEEDWQKNGSAIPSFLVKLGLTIEHAEQSLMTVEKMITTLAKQLEQEVPVWLKQNETSYFGFRISNK